MKRYYLSKIMNRAWYIRKRSFNMSMSEALKEAWKRIKNEVAMQEAFEKRMAEHKAKHERRDKENYHNYKGCVMGRSDWKRDFQNHTKVAIKRSMYLNDMAI